MPEPKADSLLMILTCNQGGTSPSLDARYSEDPEHPNRQFAEATPYAHLEASLHDRLSDWFVEGMEYDVTITPRKS